MLRDAREKKILCQQLKTHIHGRYWIQDAHKVIVYVEPSFSKSLGRQSRAVLLRIDTDLGFALLCQRQRGR